MSAQKSPASVLDQEEGVTGSNETNHIIPVDWSLICPPSKSIPVVQKRPTEKVTKSGFNQPYATTPNYEISVELSGLSGHGSCPKSFFYYLTQHLTYERCSRPRYASSEFRFNTVNSSTCGGSPEVLEGPSDVFVYTSNRSGH